MKKLFVSLMAVAALVSCNKGEEDVILTSSQKSVSVTIENAISTRAVAGAAATDVTAVGGEGKLLTAGENVVSAEYDDLVFLFANKNGEIVEIRDGKESDVTSAVETVNGEKAEVHTLTFHQVTEAATQLAVVRYGDMTPLNKVGDNLSKVRDEAADETKNKEVELDMITLYGADDLKSAGTTCQKDGNTYNLYTAKVNLAPLFARVEITYVECTDLGEATYDMANKTIDEDSAVKGYDEITLKDIKFGAGKYYYNFAENTVLYGKYTGNINDETKGVRANYATTRKYAFEDAEKEGTQYLAWNIAQQSAFSATTPLVMSVATEAYDFTNATKNTTLTVVGLTKDGSAVNTFEAGNIYRLDLDFKEANLDNYDDGICVEVEVTVAKWVVNIVEPTFKTNPATSEE